MESHDRDNSKNEDENTNRQHGSHRKCIRPMHPWVVQDRAGKCPILWYGLSSDGKTRREVFNQFVYFCNR